MYREETSGICGRPRLYPEESVGKSNSVVLRAISVSLWWGFCWVFSPQRHRGPQSLHREIFYFPTDSEGVPESFELISHPFRVRTN